jgi:hypothetical protein
MEFEFSEVVDEEDRSSALSCDVDVDVDSSFRGPEEYFLNWILT